MPHIRLFSYLSIDEHHKHFHVNDWIDCMYVDECLYQYEIDRHIVTLSRATEETGRAKGIRKEKRMID